jgi:acetylornithine deacetylase/succinyl-diaminopimelate desuccinylase-like protein
MSAKPNAALDYAHKNYNRFLDEFNDFLRIPSVAVEPEHKVDIQSAVDWVADRLRDKGLDHVEVFPTAGNPIIYGSTSDAPAAAPTLLIYGHYDVQSAAPLADWNSDPFEPVLRGDSLYARGAADMKGQIMACLYALESISRTGPTPINIKFLIEGEEELGSPHLGDFLITHRNLLSCDFSLNLDAGMAGPNSPTIVYALRGAMLCILQVTGPSHDLHSGIFGGLVYNPIHALSELIAGLHDAAGRVTLPGFYDNVRSICVEEQAELTQIAQDEALLSEQLGVSALWGEHGYSPVERTSIRPTLDVIQFQGGHPKTAIPAEATASISMRMVPDQDPNEIHQALRQYLEAHTPSMVSWDLHWQVGIPPSLMDRGSPGVQALSRALESAWGKPPVFRRGGGTIPVVPMIQEILGVESLLTGFSLPTDNMHGPDEKIHLPTWKRGIATVIYFIHNLAEQAPG